MADEDTDTGRLLHRKQSSGVRVSFIEFPYV